MVRQRNFFIFIVLVLAFILVAGCSKPGEKNVSTKEIMEKISEAHEIESGKMFDIKKDKSVSERLGISQSSIDEGIYYTNEIGGTSADEIVLLKASEDKNIQTLERAMEAEITGLSGTWENESKTEFEKVQSHILKSKGKYVILIISNNADGILKIFDDMMV